MGNAFAGEQEKAEWEELRRTARQGLRETRPSEGGQRLPMSPSPKGKQEDGTEQLVIWDEHERIHRAIDKVIAAPNERYREEYFSDLLKTLVQHEVGEQAIIHPIFRILSGANHPDFADKVKGFFSPTDYARIMKQEMEFSLFLVKLEKEFEANGYRVTEDMNAKLKQAHKDLSDHMQVEESKVLPLLESRLSQDELDQVNKLYYEFRTKAPWKPCADHTPAEIAQRLRTTQAEQFLSRIEAMGPREEKQQERAQRELEPEEQIIHEVS